MAVFRIESVFDINTGLYFVEVYQGDDKDPLFVGKPIYATHEHASADSIEIFKRAMPDQPITALQKQ